MEEDGLDESSTTFLGLPRFPAGFGMDGSFLGQWNLGLAGIRGLMVVTPDTGSRLDSWKAMIMLISESSRFEARVRGTSSPKVLGSNNYSSSIFSTNTCSMCLDGRSRLSRFFLCTSEKEQQSLPVDQSVSWQECRDFSGPQSFLEGENRPTLELLL